MTVLAATEVYFCIFSESPFFTLVIISMSLPLMIDVFILNFYFWREIQLKYILYFLSSPWTKKMYEKFLLLYNFPRKLYGEFYAWPEDRYGNSTRAGVEK